MVPKLLSILSKIPLCMSIYITCIIVVSKMLLLLLWFTYFLCDPFLFKGINNYERKRLNRGSKTWQVSCKRQELFTLCEHLGSRQVLWWGPCCSSF